uniref:Resistance protein n=1 Tax=Dulem virus 30 TaxID=3145748 RepID=A0AAU8B4F8_9CAUD
MNLYKLDRRWKNLRELLENKEVDKDVLQASLNEIGEQREEKYENIAKVIKSIELEAKAIREEKIRLDKREKMLERNAKNLKEYLASSLILRGVNKVKTKLFTFYFRKNKKLHVDEDLIEDKYIKTLKTIDTDSIRIDLQEGKEVVGAKLEESKSLIIQ